MEEVRQPVVHRSGSNEKHAASHRQSRQGSIPIRLRIAEAVGFIDDKKVGRRADARTAGTDTQLFMGDDCGVDVKPGDQCLPLWYEHGRYDERERLLLGQRDGERHVGFAEADGVCEERTAVPREGGA